jgi:hypothetical protein
MNTYDQCLSHPNTSNWGIQVVNVPLSNTKSYYKHPNTPKLHCNEVTDHIAKKHRCANLISVVRSPYTPLLHLSIYYILKINKRLIEIREIVRKFYKNQERLVLNLIVKMIMDTKSGAMFFNLEIY